MNYLIILSEILSRPPSFFLFCVLSLLDFLLHLVPLSVKQCCPFLQLLTGGVVHTIRSIAWLEWNESHKLFLILLVDWWPKDSILGGGGFGRCQSYCVFLADWRNWWMPVWDLIHRKEGIFVIESCVSVFFPGSHLCPLPYPDNFV